MKMFVLEAPDKTFVLSEHHRPDHRTVSVVHRNFDYQKIVYVDQWQGRWTQADANSPVVTNTTGDWEAFMND